MKYSVLLAAMLAVSLTACGQKKKLLLLLQLLLLKPLLLLLMLPLLLLMLPLLMLPLLLLTLLLLLLTPPLLLLTLLLPLPSNLARETKSRSYDRLFYCLFFKKTAMRSTASCNTGSGRV